MTKQYTTVKNLVSDDLRQRELVQIETISKYTIDSYFTNLVQSKAHLCAKPLKLGTVNRYVEQYLKAIKDSIK